MHIEGMSVAEHDREVRTHLGAIDTAKAEYVGEWPNLAKSQRRGRVIDVLMRSHGVLPDHLLDLRLSFSGTTLAEVTATDYNSGQVARDSDGPEQELKKVA